MKKLPYRSGHPNQCNYRRQLTAVQTQQLSTNLLEHFHEILGFPSQILYGIDYFLRQPQLCVSLCLYSRIKVACLGCAYQPHRSPLEINAQPQVSAD